MQVQSHSKRVPSCCTLHTLPSNAFRTWSFFLSPKQTLLWCAPHAQKVPTGLCNVPIRFCHEKHPALWFILPLFIYHYIRQVTSKHRRLQQARYNKLQQATTRIQHATTSQSGSVPWYSWTACFNAWLAGLLLFSTSTSPRIGGSTWVTKASWIAILAPSPTADYDTPQDPGLPDSRPLTNNAPGADARCSLAKSTADSDGPPPFLHKRQGSSRPLQLPYQETEGTEGIPLKWPLGGPSVQTLINQKLMILMSTEHSSIIA